MTDIDFLSPIRRDAMGSDLVERVAGALKRQISRYHSSGAKGGLLAAYEVALEQSLGELRRDLLIDRVRLALRNEDFQFSRILRGEPAPTGGTVYPDGEPQRRRI